MSPRSKKPESTRPDPTSRFSKMEILSIVKEVDEGLSRKTACKKYGISYITVCKWMKRHSSHYESNKPPSYSMAFKRSIAQLIIDGKMSVHQASVSNNIKSGTVSSWVRQFRKQEHQITVNSREPGKSSSAELELARLRIQALETMIDVAEEQFKINIRKKPGAKQ